MIATSVGREWPANNHGCENSSDYSRISTTIKCHFRRMKFAESKAWSDLADRFGHRTVHRARQPEQVCDGEQHRKLVRKPLVSSRLHRVVSGYLEARVESGRLPRLLLTHCRWPKSTHRRECCCSRPTRLTPYPTPLKSTLVR